jgi:hypothetical protein
MRILIVTHYFPPEIGAPQARLSELARAWADGGDEVTVLTGMPNHPTGVVPPAYRRRLRLVEQVDGYRVVRTWLYATPNEGFIKKTLGHLSFMVTSVLLGSRLIGAADVVVVSSPTFFSIFGAWAVSKFKRAPLVIDVRDLWPAIFVELGVLTNGRLIALLERCELWAYGQATEVVVVSEGFRQDLIRRGVPTERTWTASPPAETLPRAVSDSGQPTEMWSPSTSALTAFPTGSTRSSTRLPCLLTLRGRPFGSRWSAKVPIGPRWRHRSTGWG